MVLFYKIWKKYNEIQLTRNKMNLNNRKITNHPPSLVARNYLKSITFARILTIRANLENKKHTDELFTRTGACCTPRTRVVYY